MLRGNTILYPSLVDWFLNAAEAVRADKFAQPLSVPQRYEVGLRAANQPFVAAFVQASPFPESVTADRWAQPFTQPFRPSALAAYEQPYISFVKASPFAETVTADRWLQGLSQPFPTPRRAAEFPALSFSYTIIAPETVTIDKWFHPLEQPTRSARFHSGNILVKATPFPESVTADRWAQSLSTPQRYEIGLRAGSHPYYAAFVKASPFAEAVTADRWLQPLSQPFPTPRRAAAFPALSYAYTIIAAPPPPTGIHMRGFIVNLGPMTEQR